MKIIKNGSKERMLNIRRFECINCGCIFEADDSEYEEKEDYNGISQIGSEYAYKYYYCECPFCKQNTNNEVKR